MVEASLELRAANGDDCRAIAWLHHLSHTTSFRSFAAPQWVEARELDDYQTFWCGYLQIQPSNERTWVASLGDKVVGTVTIMSLVNCSALFRSQEDVAIPDYQVACLRLMYVHPEHQGKGIGRQLMSEAISFCSVAGYRLVTLITHAANRDARGFYEHTGWELDALFEKQVEEFFEDPASMRKRARYCLVID
jgi:GNAT superfamily N-acetyltransferase